MILNTNLCELIGCIIGDGNIYDKRPYYVEITGNPKDDFLYFKDLLGIIKSELNYDAKTFIRSGGIRIRINNKEFVNFLKWLGIPAGRGKFKKVRIPTKIFGGQSDLLKACIRGIVDTDGCVSFDKRKVYKDPYIRIMLHMNNRKLLSEISMILNRLHIENKLPKNYDTLYINGKENVEKYIKIIGFRNSRHSKKVDLANKKPQ